MGIFSEELKIMGQNSIFFVHEHVQREIDYLAKENYQITKEKEQAVKEAEQTCRQINTFALYTLRKVKPEDFSAKEYG